MLYKLIISTLIAMGLHLGLYGAMKFGSSSKASTLVAQQPLRMKIRQISSVPPRPKQAPPQTVTKRSPKPSSPRAIAPSQAVAVTQTEADPAPTEERESVAEELPTVSDAQYLTNPKPIYPNQSRRLGEEGRVVVKVFLQADGRPGELMLHQSSGFERLDKSALRAVQEWIFEPQQKNGSAVATWILVPIVFKLNS